jgi:hypothetical protein
MGILDSIGSSLGIGNASIGRSSQTQNSTTRTQKVLSQEAIDKLVYDVMSSDQGLAALATAENASGGYGSSSKTLLAQDLIAKVTGELANITAETVETTKGKTSNKSAKAGTVICTYLAEQGYINIQLYLRGNFHTLNLPDQTRRGYLLWAIPTVRWMKKYPLVCRLLAPTVTKRYEYIVDGKFSIAGALTVWIGQPICYVIGSFLSDEEMSNAHAV